MQEVKTDADSLLAVIPSDSRNRPIHAFPLHDHECLGQILTSAPRQLAAAYACPEAVHLRVHCHKWPVCHQIPGVCDNNGLSCGLHMHTRVICTSEGQNLQP